MSLEALLDQTCEIHGEQVTRSVTGQTARSWMLKSAAASGVACSIQQASGRRTQSDAGTNPGTVWLGLFPIDAPLAVGDHVVIGAAVWSVEALEAIRGHHIECRLSQWSTTGP